MTENLIYWSIPILTTIISLTLGYVIGNRKAKKDKLLERRTEIFENMLRSLSNLLDETMLAKSIKETFMEIKKSGIGLLFEEEYEKMVLESIKDDVQKELQKIGADAEDKDVDAFLEKFFLSLFEFFYGNLHLPIIETQLELNEDVMALQMYLDSNMKDELREKANEFNKYFEKFHRKEIDTLQLHDKASEFAEKIFEIMKF